MVSDFFLVYLSLELLMDGGIKKHYSDSLQDMIDFLLVHKVSCWSMFFGLRGYESLINTPTPLEIYDLL